MGYDTNLNLHLRHLSDRMIEKHHLPDDKATRLYIEFFWNICRSIMVYGGHDDPVDGEPDIKLPRQCKQDILDYVKGIFVKSVDVGMGCRGGVYRQFVDETETSEKETGRR